LYICIRNFFLSFNFFHPRISNFCAWKNADVNRTYICLVLLQNLPTSMKKLLELCF
jgi:hypothetical protein